ncbi:histidinol-phosphatase [Ruminococcaceae bacterium OttesenSCG-928-L11]|nr:histidinol-phosphatase [Ruminococcaceae bacterium OttesenSCG-928-L11]
MAFLSNLHTHTTYSDGKHPPREIVEAALAKGFVSLGFSDHAPSKAEAGFALAQAEVEPYVREFRALREEYAGRIELYWGMEIDALSDFTHPELDYTIGSVHFVTDPATGRGYVVDYLREMVEEGIRAMGGEDPRPFVERYYRQLCQLAETRRPDILGHMDLLEKNNAEGCLFDSAAPWYLDCCEAAVHRIAKTGVIVEVNTGAISRGYRDIPYPSRAILHMLREHQVPVTLSSDSHQADTLDFWFDNAVDLLRDVGFSSLKRMEGGAMADVEL